MTVTEEARPAVSRLTKKGLVVTVASALGEAGKSTVALCLAGAIIRSSEKSFTSGSSDRPLSVVVVDLDVKDAQLGRFITETPTPTPTALDIYVEHNWTTDLIRKNLAVDEETGIHLLLSPTGVRLNDILPPEFYRDIIGELKSMFDVIILDTAIEYLDDSVPTKVAYSMSDTIIAVLDAERMSMSRSGFSRWIQNITNSYGDFNVDSSIIRTVLNKTSGPYQIKSNLNLGGPEVPLLAEIPFNDELFSEAVVYQNLGRVLNSPKIGNQYFQLSESVVGDRHVLKNFV